MKGRNGITSVLLILSILASACSPGTADVDDLATVLARPESQRAILEDAFVTPFEFERTVAVTSVVTLVEVTATREVPELPGFYALEASIVEVHFQTDGMWRLGEYHTDSLLTLFPGESYVFSILSLWDLSVGDMALVGVHDVQLGSDDVGLINLVSQVNGVESPTSVDGSYRDRIRDFFSVSQRQVDGSGADAFVGLVESGRDWMDEVNSGGRGAAPEGLLETVRREIDSVPLAPLEGVSRESTTEPATLEPSRNLPVVTLFEESPKVESIAIEFENRGRSTVVLVNQVRSYTYQPLSVDGQTTLTIVGWGQGSDPGMDEPSMRWTAELGDVTEAHAVLIRVNGELAYAEALSSSGFSTLLAEIATPVAPGGRSETPTEDG